MSLTIEDRYRMDGKIVLDTESRSYPFLKAYPSHYRFGDSYVYLGYHAQDDLRALAKAILNAVEPEALVENQKEKATEPEPYCPQVGDVVRVIAPQFARNWGVGEHKVVKVWGGDATILHSAHGRGAFTYDELELVTPASAPTPEPEPEQQYDVPALVAAVASLEDRVADLEAADKDDEIKVGDLVRYTDKGVIPGAVRKVTDIYSTGATIRYRLVHITGYMRGEQAHSGASRDQIEKVN